MYFEPAGVIVTLVLLGQVLELRALSKTSSALKALLGMAPRTARMVRNNGREEDVPLEQVQVSDHLWFGRARRSQWTASCSKT